MGPLSFMVKSDGTIIGSSPAAKELFNVPLLHRNIRELLCPIDGIERDHTLLPSIGHSRRWCFIDKSGQRLYAKVQQQEGGISATHKIITLNIIPDNSLLKETDQIKVLVAEDNNMVLLLLSGTLSTMVPKDNITMVTNGLDAINKVKTAAYDVIIMDNKMPVNSGKRIDGIEATQRIRQIEKNLRKNPSIIFLHSADSFSVSPVEEGQEQIPDEFDNSLPKPFSRDTFEQLLERHWPAKDSVTLGHIVI